MFAYLLKSTLCLLFFLGFYDYFLSREAAHHLKRYYLLGSLIAAFAIPLIPVTVYVDHVDTQMAPTVSVLPKISAKPDIAPPSDASIIWAPYLWGAYGVGILVFGYRFIGNMQQIRSTRKQGQLLRQQKITLALLNKKVFPHTFLRTIYLNKTQYVNKEIPSQVIQHEQAHAEQLHSLDILFLEILTLLFWYNPLLYGYRKRIRTNHEYLADAAVVKELHDPRDYQHLLVDYLDQSIPKEGKQPFLAHSINYAALKKRIEMMQRTTNPKQMGKKNIGIALLLALMVYGFSARRTVNLPSKAAVVQVQYAGGSNGWLVHNGHRMTPSEFANYLSTVRPEATSLHLKIQSKDTLTQTFLHSLKKTINTQNLRRVTIAIAAEAYSMPKAAYRQHIDSSKAAISVQTKKILWQDSVETPNLGNSLGASSQKLLKLDILIDAEGNISVEGENIPIGELQAFLNTFTETLDLAERKRYFWAVVQTVQGSPEAMVSAVDDLLTQHGTIMTTIRGPLRIPVQDSFEVSVKKNGKTLSVNEYGPEKGIGQNEDTLSSTPVVARRPRQADIWAYEEAPSAIPSTPAPMELVDLSPDNVTVYLDGKSIPYTELIALEKKGKIKYMEVRQREGEKTLILIRLH